MHRYIEQLTETSLGERLGRLHRLWRMVADNELAPLGLTHPRWTALWKLRRMGDHISQKQLAESLEIELPSLMRTLGQLEQQGLITRHSCEHDKRARIVSMTAQGEEVIRSMEARIIQVRAKLLVGIDPDELAHFETVITRICDNAQHQLQQE
ncbi:transcriptional regulator SlyA [Shewanella algae]|nr:transcriptional regulator SlyA [Shewanella algae]MBO2570981.1 transcriptional regulator SlyA [Shewanella algae]